MGNLIYGGLTAAVLMGAGVGAYYVVDKSGTEHVALDADLCRTDKTLAAHRVVLLDTTDVLSADERALARQVVDGAAAASKSYERVSVYTIESASPYAPLKLFSACAPKQAADADGLSENPRLYEAIWKHRFRAPLDAAIGAELAKEKQDQSPLVESIWAISRLHNFGGGAGHRYLYVVSDMLQNTADYSQYHGSTVFKAFRRTRLGALSLPDLRGVTVVIHYLERPETLALQTKQHVEFWIAFFKAAGAASVTVEGGPRSDA